MKNLKKVLSLVLALAMAMSLMTAAFAADTDFVDNDKITKSEAVEVMTALGVLQGNAKGEFDPQGSLTRETAAKLIAYIVLGTTDAEKQAAKTAFDDVAATRWSAAYVAYCASEGIITGNGAGKFYPTTEVTGYQFGKMILCALGYDAAEKGLTGEGWEINVGKYLVAEGLDTNLEDVDMNKALTRENAAQMTLNAIKWTESGEVDGYYLDADSYRDIIFDSRSEALLYATLLGLEDMPKIKEHKDISGSLLDEVFNVALNENDTDDFGRPATSYTDVDGDYDDWDVLTFADEADWTFSNTRMKESDLFKAIGVAGAKDDTYKYITLKVVEDGYNHYDVTVKNNANGATNYVNGLGYGVSFEVYKTSTTNVYTAVAIRDYIAEVTDIIDADEDTDTARMIEVQYKNPFEDNATFTKTFETEDFEEEDMVILTIANGVVQSAVKANTIEGKLTKIATTKDKWTNIYTIGGNGYKLSQLNDGPTVDMKTEGTWYVDTYGNLMADCDVEEEAETYYGYLLKYAAEADDGDAGLLGNGTTNTIGEKFKFVNASGETVIADGAYETNKDGDITKFVASKIDNTASISGTTWSSSTANKLFAYEMNSKGEITKVYDADADSAIDASKVTKGEATLQSDDDENLLTKETVFFYVDKDDKDEVDVYVGYANAPTKEGKVASQVVEDGAINALVLEVDDLSAKSDEKYVFFSSMSYTTDLDADEENIYVYDDLYIDGVKGTLTFSATLDKNAGEMYVFTENSDGIAELSGSNLLAGTTEITNVQATYFKAGSKVYYVDNDTVYYEVDADDNTIKVVSGIKELSTKDAYDVILLGTDAVAGDTDEAATYVAYKVVK